MKALAIPLWADRFGFGVGAAIGWKYGAVSAANGSVSISRAPFALSADVLIEVGRRWYLLAAGGLYHEFGVYISGDGVLDGLSADLDSGWGGFGEFGFHYKKRHFGGSLTLRYTAIKYDLAGTSINANNWGVFGGIFYDL